MYFTIWLEKIKKQGATIPPTLLLKAQDQKGLITVYDALSNAEDILYPVLTDNDSENLYSGTYLASKLAKKVTEGFFENAELDENFAENLEYSLKDDFQAYIEILEPENQAYIYPYTKRLPINIAGIYFQQNADCQTDTISFWTSNAHCFYLRQQGLVQISDESSPENESLLDSLLADKNLLNCVNADTDFKIFSNRTNFQEPAILLVANNASIKDLSSPFHFEYLLLKTLLDSSNFDDWKEKLGTELKQNAQEDISLSLIAINFGENILQLKVAFFNRFREIEKKYIQPLQELDKTINIMRYEEKYLKMKIEQLNQQRNELKENLLNEYKQNSQKN